MIHTSITVGFTTAQYIAFQCYTDDPQDWLENVVHELVVEASDKH